MQRKNGDTTQNVPQMRRIFKQEMTAFQLLFKY